MFSTCFICALTYDIAIFTHYIKQKKALLWFSALWHIFFGSINTLTMKNWKCFSALTKMFSAWEGHCTAPCGACTEGTLPGHKSLTGHGMHRLYCTWLRYPCRACTELMCSALIRHTVEHALAMSCARLRHPCRACTELSTVLLNGALLGMHCPCIVLGYAIPVEHALTIYSILCPGMAPPIEHWNGNPNCTKCPAPLVKNILTLFLPSLPRASELSPEHSDINRGGFNVFSCSEVAARVVTFLFMRWKNRFSSHSIHWAEQRNIVP